MKKFTLLFSLLFFYACFLPAQTASLTIGTVTVCAGQEVLVPVDALNLLNVGAITLFITFDTTKLTYLSLENIDPQLSGMNYNFITNPPQLAIAWSNTIPVNFGQGKFFDIRLHSDGENTPISFSSGCEIADVSLVIIPTNYVNGSIEFGVPIITNQPHDTTITEGHDASFSVASPNATNYVWRESHDNGSTWILLNDGGVYSGTHSSQLNLTQVPFSFNGYNYRCTLIKSSCSSDSYSAKLNVDSLTTIGEVNQQFGCLGQNQPNPFFTSTTIEYCLPETGCVTLKIFDNFGKEIKRLVNTTQSKGQYSIKYDAGNLPGGIYFYAIEFQNSMSGFTRYRKMVKLLN
jgi:hypothetical protein